MITTIVPEAQHRNLKRARSRARATIRSAGKGRRVDDQHLAAARARLINHHGTRGCAMAGKGDSWTDVVGRGRGNVPWDNDWRCDRCTNKNGGSPIKWVPGKYDHCLCGLHISKNPTRYRQIRQSMDKKGGGGGKGRNGKGGESAQQRELRQIKAENDDAAEKDAIAREKDKKKQREAREAAARKSEAANAEEESEGFDVEQAKKTLDLRRADLKRFKEDQKTRKEAWIQTCVDEAEADIERLVLQLREAKPGHQQLADKAKRAARLKDELPGLLQKVRDEQDAEAEARKKADEHAQKAVEHGKKIVAHKAEIAKLAKEADALNTEHEKERPEREAVQTVVGNACKMFIDHFEDPVYQGNAEIANQKGPMQELAKNLCEGIARMARVSQTMEEYAETARKAAAAREAAAATAHVEAKEEAKVISEKTLALPACPFRHSSPERGGRRPWADEGDRGRSTGSRTATRADGHSRSPAPKSQRTATNTGKGKSNDGKGALPALVNGAEETQPEPGAPPSRHAAWSKPASERTEEEVLAMALAGAAPADKLDAAMDDAEI